MTIEFDVTPDPCSQAQVTAYLDAKIEQLRILVRSRPRPPVTDDLMRQQVRMWTYRFLAMHSRVAGNIECAENFGLISHRHAEMLRNGVMAMLQFHQGSMILGR